MVAPRPRCTCISEMTSYRSQLRELCFHISFATNSDVETVSYGKSVMCRMTLAFLRVARICACICASFAFTGCGTPQSNRFGNVHETAETRAEHAASPGLRRLLQRS
jgi:hypothetical protein